jgi:LysR family transcriptional regulator (chromosome initiation inhibitor)
MTDLPLDQIRTLLAVADEGTLDAAAKVLLVTPSAVSQRLKALEQHVGQVLLLRTKPVRLTEGGRTVVRFARQLALLEQDLRTELDATGVGEPIRLSIAVNSDSLATWFLPALSRVPPDLQICFELHREDQDRTERLLREGLVMAAVTSSADAVAGCSIRPLGRMRYRPVASPDFATRHLPGWPDVPLRRLLPEAPVVTFDRHDDLQDRYVRALTRGRGASPRRHAVPASESFVEAVLAGLGWGMVPHAQAAPHLAGNRLLDLDPGRPIDVPLYWQQWKLHSPALAAVAGAVTAAAGELDTSLSQPSRQPRPRARRTP